MGLHMKQLIVMALVLVAAGACNAPPDQVAQSSAAEAGDGVAPREALVAAAASPKDGAEGVFEFRVASVGGGRGRIFLNSEADYRDPANLSVMLRPADVKQMEKALGGPLAKTLVEKNVSVTGTAKQVKINVYGPDRKKTGETRTQTRIVVASADSIVVK